MTQEGTRAAQESGESTEHDGAAAAVPSGLRVAICVTGSLYATQVPGYVMRLRRYLTDDVRVVMTPAAQDFISAATMQQYCSGRVHVDSWDTFADGRPSHIGLAKWADCLLVLPLTANSLAKTAAGLADSLAMELVIAADPALTALAPAMNFTMWNSPSVRRNLRTVQADGFTVLDTMPAPEVGRPAGPPDGVAPRLESVWAWLQHRSDEVGRPPATGQD